MKTVIGLYVTLDDAHKVVRELINNGIDRHNISLIASGGLLGALTEAGIPEEEARFYVEGVRHGGILVAVKVFNDQVDRVVDVMEQHNPVDIEQRAATWTDGDEEPVEMPAADLVTE